MFLSFLYNFSLAFEYLGTYFPRLPVFPVISLLPASIFIPLLTGEVFGTILSLCQFSGPCSSVLSSLEKVRFLRVGGTFHGFLLSPAVYIPKGITSVPSVIAVF